MSEPPSGDFADDAADHEHEEHEVVEPAPEALESSLKDINTSLEPYFKSVMRPHIADLVKPHFSHLIDSSAFSTWSAISPLYTQFSPIIASAARSYFPFGTQFQLFTPGTGWTSKLLNQSVHPMFETIYRDQGLSSRLESLLPVTNWWGNLLLGRGILEQLQRALTRRVIPENLADAGITDTDDERVRDVLLDGIPLFWVPRARIAQRLISAETRSVRRTIIGHELEAILEDCTEVLEMVSAEGYIYMADRLQEAINIYPQSSSGAQSLATVILDSLVYGLKDVKVAHYTALTTTNSRGKEKNIQDASDSIFQDLGPRGHLALLPVYMVYDQFTPAGPGRSPTRSDFNRHASLHRVSPRQYTKRNAVIAIMLATSALLYVSRWYQYDLQRSARAA